MALNPAEYSFAKRHYTEEKIASIADATQTFDQFDERYLYDYDEVYLAHLLRTDSNVQKMYSRAVYDLEQEADNPIIKCKLARLYAIKYNYYQFEKALSFAYEGAEAGLAEAQWVYGNLMLKRSRNENYQTAKYYFSKAADQGHSIAICDLGKLYNDWDLPIHDTNKALDCFHKANTHNGIYLIAGDLSFKGRYSKAKELLEMIADQYPYAYYGLGLIYADKGCPFRNTYEAYRSFRRCEQWGYWKSYDQLALLYCKYGFKGPESADYWLNKAIDYRNMRVVMCEERDRYQPAPLYVPKELRSLYYEKGYTNLPKNESEGSSPVSSTLSRSDGKRTGCISTIIVLSIVAFLVAKFCF